MRSKLPACIITPIEYFLNVFLLSWTWYYLYNLDKLSGFMILFDVLFIVLLGAGVIVFTFSIISLKNNKKRIAYGVLTIIFCSLVGGIFYLVWNPNYDEDRKEENIIKRKQEKKSSYSDPYDNLKKLKELYDSGIIDKKTYEEKSKKYLDLL